MGAARRNTVQHIATEAAESNGSPTPRPAILYGGNANHPRKENF